MVRGELTNTTRRRVLRGVASGAFVGAAFGTASADETASVFVHGSKPVQAVRDEGGVVTFKYDNFDFVAARVPDVGELRRDPRVTKVERDGAVEALHHREGHDGGPPGGGDGGSTSQTLPWGVDRIDADKVSAGASGVDVAILDTGIDLSHPDLSVQGGTDCTGTGGSSYDDKNGHGTHCAGIVAALDNDQGVVGVAPAANLWAVKVLGNGGSGSWSNVVCGIDWCMTNGREILSMSLGGGYNSTVEVALSNAYSAGHVLVAAAGNDGNDQDGGCEENNVGFPASHPDVIAVSAMTGDADGSNDDDVIASYSSVGDAAAEEMADGENDVELMAPGTEVYSTYKGDSYQTLSGTSMACPHVSGVAALVWEDIGASLASGDNATVRQTMRDTAETAIGTCEEGSGLVDAERAVG